VEEVDLRKGLSEADLDALIGKRDHRLFLNPRNSLYRGRNMKESPPGRAEALHLMASNPNLIRRPILVKGKQVEVGFEQEKYKEMLS
jgi:arsenate reductase